MPTQPQPNESMLLEMEFSTPLEYTEIRSNKLSHYSIVIAVCCYSGWPITTSSNLASMSLPLTTAVKTIMPTWFGLQPCVVTQQPKPRKQSQKATVSAMEKPRKPIHAWVENNNSEIVRDENSKQTERKQTAFSWKGVKNVWQSVSTIGHHGSQVKAFSSEKQPTDLVPSEAADQMLEKEERNALIEVTTLRPIESFRINRSVPDPFAVPSPEKPIESKKHKPPMVKTRASAELIDILDEDLSAIPVAEERIKLSKTVRFNTDATPTPIILPIPGTKSDSFVPCPPPRIKTRQSATLIETNLTDDYVCEYLKQGMDKKPQYSARNDYHSNRPRVREGWT